MMDDLRELYQEVILDHSRNPRNCRHPEDATCHARGNNPLCGDQVTVFLKLDAQGIVADAAFQGRGCAISVASASMMTDLVKGKTEAEARSLFERFHAMCTSADAAAADDTELEKLKVLSGVRDFPMRVKCATLPWHALQAALAGDEEVTTEK